MSLWAERYNAHPLWSSVGEIRAKINALDVQAGNHDELRALEYHGMVLEHLEARRTETDPLVVVPSMLEAVRSPVAQWAATLDEVNGGALSLADAVGVVDQIMASLSSWPPVKPARYFSGVWMAAEAYQAKIQEVLDDFVVRAGTVETRVETAEKDADLLASKLDTEKQRLAEALANFSRESGEQVAGEIATLRDNSAQALKRMDEQRQSAEARAQQTLETLEDYRKKAADTVHATTAAVVATDYGKYARNKTFAAWVCDIAAALVGAAGVGAILLHLFTLEEGSGDVGISLTRLAASLGTLGIAALLGRRGAQHHKEARAAKRTDLALRRVGPFIVDIDAQERREILLELTERVFIRGDLDGDSPSQTSTLFDRIKALRISRQPAGTDSQ